MDCPNCGKQINDNAKFCEHCGKSTINNSEEANLQNSPPTQQTTPTPIQQVVYAQVYYPQPVLTEKTNSGSAILRLIVGIISIVLFFLISLYSCSLGMKNAMELNSTFSGSVGFFIGLIMLTAGTISIATRKSIGGAITAACFYFIAGLSGQFYKDLVGWAVLSYMFFILIVISVIVDIVKKSKKSQ